jgi:hypothetical protein
MALQNIAPFKLKTKVKLFKNIAPSRTSENKNSVSE